MLDNIVYADHPSSFICIVLSFLLYRLKCGGFSIFVVMPLTPSFQRGGTAPLQMLLLPGLRCTDPHEPAWAEPLFGMLQPP